MRHGASNNRRPRGRNNNNNNRNKGGNSRSQVFDSNGPDVRIRGTAHQICEKYTALAKDARSTGDIVLAESYLQHAEHYQRIISSYEESNKAAQKPKHEQKESDGNKQNSNDDLALPSSILGDEVKVASQGSSSAVRAKEEVLEDA